MENRASKYTVFFIFLPVQYTVILRSKCTLYTVLYSNVIQIVTITVCLSVYTAYHTAGNNNNNTKKYRVGWQ